MCGLLLCMVFFFKQKTAYEMRISDWSSDVCSSDLVEGVSDLRDESDAQTRIVIELKRDAIPRVVLNQLYKHTSMQSTFGVIMLALEIGRASCRDRVCQYV